MRRHLSYANVMATVAVFIALGGSSYAAMTLSKNDVRSRHIKNGQVKAPDLARNAVRSSKVKNGSLLAADFKLGELPAGPQGLQGPQGPHGPKGETGTVDTSNFYDKAASDGRFLGLNATAADAHKLDGKDATEFLGKTDTAADADKLDGRDSSSFLGAGKVRSASINANGTAARNDGFARVIHGTGQCNAFGGTDSACTGTYFLDLPAGVSALNCSLVAMVGRTGHGASGTHLSSTPGIATANPDRSAFPEGVNVTTRTIDGVPQDLPFHLIAVC